MAERAPGGQRETGNSPDLSPSRAVPSPIGGVITLAKHTAIGSVDADGLAFDISKIKMSRGLRLLLQSDKRFYDAFAKLH